MKKCITCKEDKPETEFYKSSRKDGLQPHCKICAAAASLVYVNKNRIALYERNTIYKRDLFARVDTWKEQQGCKYCPETTPCCLELHHLDPTKKENHPSLMRTSWDRYMKEAEKCVVVCSNCHKKIHKGIVLTERTK